MVKKNKVIVIALLVAVGSCNAMQENKRVRFDLAPGCFLERSELNRLSSEQKRALLGTVPSAPKVSSRARALPVSVNPLVNTALRVLQEPQDPAVRRVSVQVLQPTNVSVDPVKEVFAMMAAGNIRINDLVDTQSGKITQSGVIQNGIFYPKSVVPALSTLVPDLSADAQELLDFVDFLKEQRQNVGSNKRARCESIGSVTLFKKTSKE